MFQTNTHNSNKKLKQNHPEFVNEQLSLPLIPKRTSSRSQVSSRKELLEKEKIVFPDIQNSEGNFETLTEIDLDKENKEQLNKSSFTREVQEKLNFVLGEIPQYEQQSDNDNDADSYDFEAKVNENKKILQQNRLKKDTNNEQKRIVTVPKQFWERKKKIESLYEKRAKEYKGQSVENKYLSKRKETIKEKVVNSQNNIQLAKKRENGENILKPKNSHRRAMSHKGSIKSLASNEVLKNDNLFDGIQNYLENPREVKKTENQKLVGLSLLKIKREIEDKIKDINIKLGIEETTENNQEKCLNITAKDWRRVEMNNEKLNYHHSNFEAEIDRIGSLQERNSSCLEQYLQNQKMLLGINLHKREASRNINIRSE